MNGIVILMIGLGIFFLALSSKDEIHRIAALVGGTISLIWGFALTPLPFQLLVESVSVVGAFFVCMRCLGCGSTR